MRITDENMFKQNETVFAVGTGNGFVQESDRYITKLGVNPHRPNNWNDQITMYYFLFKT